ncbi:MAG: inositol monophosphatase [Firmicutes bacterium]|nr:inositol monophosphatase [Bacillota bacterium]
MEKQFKEYLEFAKGVAARAGEIMLKYFNAKDISQYKGDQTIVTLADTEINSYLIERVKETYPSHAVFGEEEQYGEGNYLWVCDPVDGTAQFARRIPVAVFSLALVIDGVSVLGVVFDPFLGEMYWAIKGYGAFKNGEKIQVNDYKLDDKRAMGSYDMWARAASRLNLGTIPLKHVYCTSIGSCVRAAMTVADGHYSFQLFPGTTFHDIAAAKVIVEEAGGIVRNFYGEEDRMDSPINGAIISSKVVYDEVFEAVRKNVDVSVLG